VKSAKSSSIAETARYIGGMARELRALALKSELGFLAYLLSMVEQESDQQAGEKTAHGKHPGSS
jgi:hypothetical protein